ncbi:protein of unknown function [Azospirillum baldaniorum]|uniref:Uncharacterized protein n=1 Tax=Azospirillum baldaniorum TaxID=1064539 RepID=A0A9P1JRX6_9PROT|nr:protein of unknown function [Azospirillum baldaniorum]
MGICAKLLLIMDYRISFKVSTTPNRMDTFCIFYHFLADSRTLWMREGGSRFMWVAKSSRPKTDRRHSCQRSASTPCRVRPMIATALSP